MLRFYNTLTKEKEEFKPMHQGKVGMYSCGPTVYNYPHIGNYRAYIFSDLLKRYLKYSGYVVKHIMNITDVDDKTIRDSQIAHKSLKEFTEFYTQGFFEDLDKLNIERADLYPRATDHIQDMVNIIKKLLENGHAYKGEDNSIYFNIKEFPAYGQLSGFKIEELKEDASGRMKNDEYGKENAQDFALWKAYDEKDGNNYWDTEIGKGRPGWHIECSAMSTKYLGEHFDIHTGGVDLIFPHHENEIAQSECCYEKKFVNYWLHNEWLLVDGKKMSKSLGNFYTLRNILDKSHSTKAFRYMMLSTHYKVQLNFTFDGLKAAESVIEKFKEFMTKLAEPQEGAHSDIHQLVMKTKHEFIEAMNDDLNISEALAPIFEFMKEINRLMSEQKLDQQNAEQCINLMNNFDKVLGILDFSSDMHEVPEEIIRLADERQQARKNRDFKRADEIRLILKEKGYYIDDTMQGMRIKRL